MGKRAIIFDADFGLANVEVMFGAIPKYNLGDLLYKGKTIQEIITRGPEGIEFISGGTGIAGLDNLSIDQIQQMVRCLNELDKLADFIIIDTGAGISAHVLEFVMASPEVLLVTTPDPSSLTDTYSLLKTLYRNPSFVQEKTDISVISNRVETPEEGQHVYQKLNSVVTQFLQGDIDYIGMVPQDSTLEKAIRQQKAVSLYAPLSKSAKAFEVIAANLLNYERRELQMRSGIAALFSNFWNPKY